MNETPATLDAWEARCRAHGLSITPSRRAILAAMLQRETTCDAVTWLLAAQAHHAPTSLNTVYRFLREMERRELADVEASPHARCRWRLHHAGPVIEVDAMLRQLQAFLQGMEALESAQATSTADASSTVIGASNAAPAWYLLQGIAERLGYRLVSRMHPAY